MYRNVQEPRVPEGLREMMKDFTKAILSEKPRDVYEFSDEYFQNKLVMKNQYDVREFEPLRVQDYSGTLQHNHSQYHIVPLSLVHSIVPTIITDLMKGFIKAVLKQKPQNLCDFAAVYFRRLRSTYCAQHNICYQAYENYLKQKKPFVHFGSTYIKCSCGRILSSDFTGELNYKNDIAEGSKILPDQASKMMKEDNLNEKYSEKYLRAICTIQRYFRKYLRHKDSKEPERRMTMERAVLIIQKWLRNVLRRRRLERLKRSEYEMDNNSEIETSYTSASTVLLAGESGTEPNHPVMPLQLENGTIHSGDEETIRMEYPSNGLRKIAKENPDCEDGVFDSGQEVIDERVPIVEMESQLLNDTVIHETYNDLTNLRSRNLEEVKDSREMNSVVPEVDGILASTNNKPISDYDKPQTRNTLFTLPQESIGFVIEDKAGISNAEDVASVIVEQIPEDKESGMKNDLSDSSVSENPEAMDAMYEEVSSKLQTAERDGPANEIQRNICGNPSEVVEVEGQENVMECTEDKVHFNQNGKSTENISPGPQDHEAELVDKKERIKGSECSNEMDTQSKMNEASRKSDSPSHESKSLSPEVSALESSQEILDEVNKQPIQTREEEHPLISDDIVLDNDEDSRKEVPTVLNQPDKVPRDIPNSEDTIPTAVYTEEVKLVNLDESEVGTNEFLDNENSNQINGPQAVLNSRQKAPDVVTNEMNSHLENNQASSGSNDLPNELKGDSNETLEHGMRAIELSKEMIEQVGEVGPLLVKAEKDGLLSMETRENASSDSLLNDTINSKEVVESTQEIFTQITEENGTLKHNEFPDQNFQNDKIENDSNAVESVDDKAPEAVLMIDTNSQLETNDEVNETHLSKEKDFQEGIIPSDKEIKNRDSHLTNLDEAIQSTHEGTESNSKTEESEDIRDTNPETLINPIRETSHDKNSFDESAHIEKAPQKCEDESNSDGRNLKLFSENTFDKTDSHSTQSGTKENESEDKWKSGEVENISKSEIERNIEENETGTKQDKDMNSRVSATGPNEKKSVEEDIKSPGNTENFYSVTVKSKPSAKLDETQIPGENFSDKKDKTNDDGIRDDGMKEVNEDRQTVDEESRLIVLGNQSERDLDTSSSSSMNPEEYLDLKCDNFGERIFYESFDDGGGNKIITDTDFDENNHDDFPSTSKSKQALDTSSSHIRRTTERDENENAIDGVSKPDREISLDLPESRVDLPESTVSHLLSVDRYFDGNISERIHSNEIHEILNSTDLNNNGVPIVPRNRESEVSKEEHLADSMAAEEILSSTNARLKSDAEIIQYATPISKNSEGNESDISQSKVDLEDDIRKTDELTGSIDDFKNNSCSMRSPNAGINKLPKGNDDPSKEKDFQLDITTTSIPPITDKIDGEQEKCEKADENLEENGSNEIRSETNRNKNEATTIRNGNEMDEESKPLSIEEDLLSNPDAANGADNPSITMKAANGKRNLEASTDLVSQELFIAKEHRKDGSQDQQEDGSHQEITAYREKELGPRNINTLNILSDFLNAERFHSYIVNQKSRNTRITYSEELRRTMTAFMDSVGDLNSTINQKVEEVEEPCVKKILNINLIKNTEEGNEDRENSCEVLSDDDSLERKTEKMQRADFVIQKMMQRQESSGKISSNEKVQIKSNAHNSLDTDEQNIALGKLSNTESSGSSGHSDVVYGSGVEEKNPKCKKGLMKSVTIDDSVRYIDRLPSGENSILDRDTSEIIRRKIMAYSVSDNDSDLIEKMESDGDGDVSDDKYDIGYDNFNISTGLTDNIDTSTETEVTIVSTGRKMQTNDRGIFGGRRLGRTSITSGTKESRTSIGAGAFSESIEYLVQEAAAKLIQNAYRMHRQSNINRINGKSIEAMPNELASKRSLLKQRRLTLQRGDALRDDSITEEAFNGSSSNENENERHHRSANKIFDNRKPIRGNKHQKHMSGWNWNWISLRQNSMPVQIDSEVFRVIPRRLRKRVQSAEMKGKKSSTSHFGGKRSQ